MVQMGPLLSSRCCYDGPRHGCRMGEISSRASKLPASNIITVSHEDVECGGVMCGRPEMYKLSGIYARYGCLHKSWAELHNTLGRPGMAKGLGDFPL